jgi:hypothetical protein
VAALALREINNHLFYRLRVAQAEMGRFKQELWQKQLRLEGLTHPGRVLQQADPQDDETP